MQYDMSYGKKLWGSVSILLGAGLITEHIWSWGAFETLDFIGHEWLGVLLILVGIVLNAQNTGLSKEIKKFFKIK
mgnify:CR=1 FL=1